MALSVCLLLAACSIGPDPTKGDSLTWDAVSAPRFTDDVLAAAFLSTGLIHGGDPEGRGALVFIHRDGSTSFLKTDALDNGTPAFNGRGEITLSTELRSYKIAGDSSARSKHTGYTGTGHWSGSTSDGSLISVFNSADSNVSWWDGGDLAHAVVPVTPSAAGTAGGKLYVTNLVSPELDEWTVLYEVDLTKPGTVKEALRWKLPDAAAGWASAGTSDLFHADGALWFFDETVMLNSDGDQITAPDGSRSTLRLGRIDREDDEFTSTRLAGYPHDSIIDTDKQPSLVAQAAIRGHMWDDTLYTIDHRGMLLAADVKTRHLEDVALVSEAARTASTVRVSWHEQIMTILMADDESAHLETYDLKSGKRLSSLDVPGLATFMAENPNHILWSQASGPAVLPR